MKTQMTRRGLAVLALAAVGVATLVVGRPLLSSHNQLSDIRASGVAELLLPGSTLNERHTQTPRAFGVDGGINGNIRTIAQAPATRQEVSDFYHARLEGAGWTFTGRSLFLNEGETSSVSWKKGRLVADLGFMPDTHDGIVHYRYDIGVQ